MKPQHTKRLERFERLAATLMTDLAPKLIYNTDDGGWIMYEKFSIYKTGDEMYTVSGLQGLMTAKKFHKLRNAVTWAVLYEQNKVYEANRVATLDLMIGGLDVEKQQHKRLKNTKDTERYLIQHTKLIDDIVRQKQFIAELDKYIITAKLSQLRGFENELKRISREQ